MIESERSPWSRSPQEVLQWLEVDAETGLDSKTVSVRRERYGLNVLQERPRRSLLSIFFAQFRSLLVALLAAALAAAIFYQEWVEASAIGSVLLVNALIGFLTELRAVRSMEALRTLGKTEARVLRDGRAQAVDAEMLVPGDIVLLEGGDVVSADARLLSASKLQTNESALTGESEPVEKRVEAVAAESPIAERTSQLYRGTVVTRGSATAVVTATGVESELGQISQLVAETQGESTPLEKRLNRLGRGLVWATLFVAAMVLVLGVLAGEPMFLLVETAIALAVAAVPEGLPILATIALARGMGRMAKQNALVNRLSAVETLGATQILCTDKTGTLTENEMRVVSLEVVSAADAAQRALEVAVLCNNASLDGAGDPTEVALLEFAATRNVLRDHLADEFSERHEVAFDSDVMMMATLNGSDSPYRVCVKGAPEPVLGACNLESTAREEWARKSAEFADQGLRVLALAEGASATLTDDVYRELEFLGLVAMHDPPRPEVKGTIEEFERAGLRVVMITGDHPVTAQSIARATGIDGATKGAAVLGEHVDATASGTDLQAILGASVFARVSPKQKLDLIALHQNAGSVVAMTGDGVNDAPALNKADIGVAMGKRGTAAAREAADMVLKDDNLQTMVVAIREGRVIFDNIRKFVVYLLSCNISEVLVVSIASLVGLPLPLTPLQILFLNLVTDVFPALALGLCRPSDRVMQQPPRPKDEPILGPRRWWRIVWYGLMITASVHLAWALAGGTGTTVPFLTLAFAQLWHVFTMRESSSPFLQNEVTENRWVWGALVLCCGILAAAYFLPGFAGLLSLEALSWGGLALVLVASVVPLIVIQLVRRAVSAAAPPAMPKPRPQPS